jgi:hypothetical protein
LNSFFHIPKKFPQNKLSVPVSLPPHPSPLPQGERGNNALVEVVIPYGSSSSSTETHSNLWTQTSAETEKSALICRAGKPASLAFPVELVVLVHLVVLVVIFNFFLTFPPARFPATNCGYLCLYQKEGIFRCKR